MNPSGDNTYFRDDTGNRRFWPVSCGEIKIPELRAVRNQLFAEAVVVYKQGFKLYLSGKALIDAEKEQAKRQTIDPWEDDVARLIVQKPEVTTTDVLGMLSIPQSQRGISEQMRIGKILKKLGWHKHQDASGMRIYRREEVKMQGRYAKSPEEMQWTE